MESHIKLLGTSLVLWSVYEVLSLFCTNDRGIILINSCRIMQAMCTGGIGMGLYKDCLLRFRDRTFKA